MRGRTLVLGVLVAAVVLAAAAAWALEPPQAIKPARAGGVKLGATYTSLREKGRLGKIKKGCELAGPKARSARLLPPLKGTVDFTFKEPRRVAQINVTGGATARSVGVGSTTTDITTAFPGAIVDHSTDKTFGFTLVKVPKRIGGSFHFAVDVATGKVTTIGIPVLAVCE